jgi:general transcription factor 3C polypeptide 2
MTFYLLQYLAVAAHPPGSSYHKIGMPLIGRGIVQVWCLVAPFEEEYTHHSMIAYSKSNRRGRPRKIPDVNNSIDNSSVPRKPVGRPRKIKLKITDDHVEASLRRPRGRPRKYPLSVAKVLDSTRN